MSDSYNFNGFKRINTGSEIIDVLLEGGLEPGIITTVYGPAGSGKTNLCILSSINVAKHGKRVLYLDSEGGFSVERMKQIDPDYLNTISKFSFLTPMSFDEQKLVFRKLISLVDNSVGLIVVDSISMLYRLKLGRGNDISDLNNELIKQLSVLTQIARTKRIPILITNQVYADFENRGRVRMVGGDMLKYSSKCLIELTHPPGGPRRAILQKHRSIPEESEVKIKIVNTGIDELKTDPVIKYENKHSGFDDKN